MIEDTVVEGIDDPVVVVDRDRRVVECNPAAATVADGGREAIAGSPLDSVLPHLVDAVPGSDATSDGDRRTGVEIDGRHYDVRASRLDDSGSPGEWVIVLREVTERVRRERELKRSERMLDTVGDLVYALDEVGTIVGVNDTAAEVSGYDRETLVGSHVSLLMDDEDLQAGRELIVELLSDPSRDRGTFEMDLITADGERIRCENRLALLEGDGEFEGTLGVLRDVTEQRRRAEQLNVLNRVVRHDLRTDLNLIVGNAELMTEDPENAGEYVDDIRSTARSVIARSNRIRRIERVLEEGPDDEGPVEVTALVTDRVGALREEHPEATVETELPERAWAGAPEFLAVAVDNALENAVLHNDADPEIRVSVGIEGDQVEIAVADNGPGIPSGEIRSLDRHRETPLEHTSGLGLWTIHWVVDQFGGTLTFDDGDPRGSVVRMRLPLADAPDAEGSPGRGAAGGTGGSSGDEGQHGSGRIDATAESDGDSTGRSDDSE